MNKIHQYATVIRSFYIDLIIVYIEFILVLLCIGTTGIQLKGSYDAISSFPFFLECYKLFVHW